MNADKLASAYRWLEYAAFGRTLERCRAEQLGALKSAPRRVLILGEGDGRFLAELVARFPAARVDVIELSEKMILLARGRLPAVEHGRVKFVHGDALSLAGEERYDLIVTNFFLDCLSTGQAADLIGNVAARLTEGARWAVGEFRIPQQGVWRRWYATVWVKTMYFVFWATTGLRTNRLPDYERCLESAGLRMVSERLWRWGLVTSQMWEV